MNAESIDVFLAILQRRDFQHKLTFDRFSLTLWLLRIFKEKLTALVYESLSVATPTGGMKPVDISKIIVNTTIHGKTFALPTNATMMHCVLKRLGRLAKK